MPITSISVLALFHHVLLSVALLVFRLSQYVLFFFPKCAELIAHATGSPFESVVVVFRAIISAFSSVAFGESENFRSVTLLTEIHPAHVSFLYLSFSVALFTFSPASVLRCSTSGKSAFFWV